MPIQSVGLEVPLLKKAATIVSPFTYSRRPALMYGGAGGGGAGDGEGGGEWGDGGGGDGGEGGGGSGPPRPGVHTIVSMAIHRVHDLDAVTLSPLGAHSLNLSGVVLKSFWNHLLQSSSLKSLMVEQ